MGKKCDYTDGASDRTFLMYGLLLGGIAGFSIGRAVAEKQQYERTKMETLQREMVELRKKVDPDYKDPYMPQSPIPVKVVE